VAHFEEKGAVLDGSQQGTCRGFTIELSMDSDHNVEDIVKLIRLAHRMCFTESALTAAVEVKTSHFFNGQPIEINNSQN